MMAAACTRVVWIRKRTATTPKPTPVPRNTVYFGCTDAAADNYDAGANADDGTCLYTGCMDEAADNYTHRPTGDQAAILYTGYYNMAELRCPGEHG